MAEIMGLELKGVKTFIGTDGYGLSANLYLKGKKVASVLDEGNGRGLNVSFLDNSKKDEIFTIAQKYYKKYPKFILYDNEKWAKLNELIEELYSLYQTEKYFKKQVKKDYPIIIEIHYIKRTDNFMKNYSPSKQDCMVAFKEWSDKSKKHLIEEYQPVEYKVYQKLKDFIIE